MGIYSKLRDWFYFNCGGISHYESQKLAKGAQWSKRVPDKPTPSSSPPPSLSSTPSSLIEEAIKHSHRIELQEGTGMGDAQEAKPTICIKCVHCDYVKFLVGMGFSMLRCRTTIDFVTGEYTKHDCYDINTRGKCSMFKERGEIK